jgi:hypothetical protein
MKKRARGKRRGRGHGTRGTVQESAAAPQDSRTQKLGTQESGAPDFGAPPVLLSISPEGVRLPNQPSPSTDAARLRRDLERHAQDVEEFVRAKRFEAIVTRVLADVERPEAPPLRIRQTE